MMVCQQQARDLQWAHPGAWERGDTQVPGVAGDTSLQSFGSRGGIQAAINC